MPEKIASSEGEFNVPGKEQRIVLVDDQDTILEISREFLEDAGYKNITCFSDPVAAKSHLQENPTDILITDFNFGRTDLNGLELLDAVPDVPKKIVMSGSFSSDPGLRNACRQRNAATLNKPFRAENLVKLVAEIAEGDRE